MKVNVKGLVFVGAAAAILLSAGAANAAKTARSSDASGIVTSQKYSDEKYEYWADKVEAQSSQANLGTIVNNTTNSANDNKYPSLSAMKQYVIPSDATLKSANHEGDLAQFTTNGLGKVDFVSDADMDAAAAAAEVPGADPYVGSDNAVLSEKAVVSALDAVEASITQNEVVGSTYINVDENANGQGTVVSVQNIIGTNATDNDVNTDGNSTKLTTANTVQIKQSDTGKFQVSKDKEWTDVRNAISADGVYLEETENTTDGSTSIGIKEANLIKSAANVVSATDAASGADKLVTASATQSRSATAHQIATATGGWEAISSGVTDGTYVTKQSTSDGTVKLDIAAATSANAINSASSASSTTLVTDYAVKQYVSTTGLGGTLNPMPAECGYAGAHCALVSSVGQNGIELTWTVMAGGEGTAPANP